MRITIVNSQEPQQVGDFRFHKGYGLSIQVTKGQTASGVRIDTDPSVLMGGGGLTIDPAPDATHAGGSFTFTNFQDRLYAVVDTGTTDIKVDVLRWRREEQEGQITDMRKQTLYGGYETHPDMGVGVPTAK